ncbi:MAG: hypothetical protein ACOYXB_07955 [Bacteroidota bacterium]
MKKKFLRLTAAFVIMAAVVPACNLLEDCGTCELDYQYSDGTIEYGTPLIYCGEDYQNKLNSTPTTILGVTTYWSCE